MVQEIDKIQKDNIQKIDKDCFILQVLKRLFKNKLALAGGIVVLLFLIVGCLAPVLLKNTGWEQIIWDDVFYHVYYMVRRPLY